MYIKDFIAQLAKRPDVDTILLRTPEGYRTLRFAGCGLTGITVLEIDEESPVQCGPSFLELADLFDKVRPKPRARKVVAESGPRRMARKLSLANEVATRIQHKYGFRMEKCVAIVLSCPWFETDRVQLPTADEVYDEVVNHIETQEVV